MKGRILVFSLLFLFSPAMPAFPWGGVHSLINEYAVGNLPPEMVDDGSGNAFGDMAWYLRDHAFDPDLQKETDPLEAERHWCDIDSRIDDYPPPFSSGPRDYDTDCKIFGRSNGVVQWEGIRDHYGALVGLMRARDWPAAYQVAAELGHYVGDATCPLHATENYDGQLSADIRNVGIHGRYEGAMVEIFISEIGTSPDSATLVPDPLELGFTILAGGWELVDSIMAADLTAQDLTGSNESEEYYQALFGLVGTDAQARLDLAAKHLADLWYSAWVEAGRPSFSPFPPTPTATPSSADTVVPTSTSTPTATPSPTDTGVPTSTPAPIPHRDIELLLSSVTPRVGERFTAEAVVNKAIHVSFDAYCVIMGPGNSILSVVSPHRLQGGIVPFASGVPGIDAGFRRRILDRIVSGVIPGEYRIIIGIVPAKSSPHFRAAICYDIEYVDIVGNPLSFSMLWAKGMG